MSKTTVTRLFVGAIVAVIAGWVIAIAAVVAALVDGGVVIGGPDIVTVNVAGFGLPLIVLAIAMLLVVGGSLLGLLSWIGALAATARLEDKTWFVVLLVLGLWSFGLVAMVAYVVAGPDGAAQRRAPTGVATASQG